jgi:peptide-methionine (S)-S-oxide reductase
MYKLYLFIVVIVFNGNNILGQQLKFKNTEMTTNLETATLANGCFWCTEAIFQSLKGVESVVSGYTGGDIKNPTYSEVSLGSTGHAEAIEITFNPDIISFQEILDVFFSTHDPTTLNRQGYDVGTQYRSAIFYHSEKQKEVAEKFIKALTDAKVFDKKIVTQIVPFKQFYKAESYHQNYYNNNKNQGYCRAVINPKLEKFIKKYKDKLKKN